MRNEIRKQMKNKRGLLEETFMQEASQIICKQILSLLQNQNVIATYQPIQNEVDVSNLANKQLLYPKVINEQTMKMILPKSYERGAFSILEPIGEEVVKTKIDAILVPLLAFDRKGNRLGYGKGYYDRYLHDFDGLKIGIAYAFQEVAEIETNAFDECLDYVITEQEIICMK